MLVHHHFVRHVRIVDIVSIGVRLRTIQIPVSVRVALELTSLHMLQSRRPLRCNRLIRRGAFLAFSLMTLLILLLVSSSCNAGQA